MNVPFFRPAIGDAEIMEVSNCLRSGWLTTGPLTKRFEALFAEQVGAKHAVAVNSGTAALHLAVGALGLRAGQAVLVPTMSFAATAEVVLCQGAVPIPVDCDPVTLNMDLQDATKKIALIRSGRLPVRVPDDLEPAGMIPVHVGGLVMDYGKIESFAREHGLWVVEDAAHAFPAAWRSGPDNPWRRCGQRTAAVTCYSFYANKTITTGEGGMAVTEDAALADHMRLMSLHGLSQDAWGRDSGDGNWDYQIIAPGHKYNLSDVAAAIGIHQLRRSEEMRVARAALSQAYYHALAEVDELELPPDPPDRIHAWHLFPVRLRLAKLTIDRNTFIRELQKAGIGCSVHWRPLHLHQPRSPRKILDFGCNSGHPLKRVCTVLGSEGTGLDVNAAAIEKARRDNPDARFLSYDGNAIPLEEESFDHVMLHHVLGHVENPHDTIGQLVRVLRPGGTISAITANAHYKLWQISFNIVNDFLPDKTALRYYTARSLRHLLRRHELTVQSLSTHGATPSFCPSLARRKCGLFLVAFAVKPELGTQ